MSDGTYTCAYVYCFWRLEAAALLRALSRYLFRLASAGASRIWEYPSPFRRYANRVENALIQKARY